MQTLLWSVWWLGLATAVAADELPFVNFEHHPQRALDISPDGRWLAAAHTADARVQLFRIGPTGPVPAGSVKVGLDPVAVRFRDAGELWVANHVSDSISVVDPVRRQVTRTLPTGDEPFDIAFAAGRAFVSCSQVNQVWVFDPADPDQTARIVPINAEDPRALSVSADGRSVAVAVFESGNRSTVLGGGLAGNRPVMGIPNVVSDPRGPHGGVNPPPNTAQGFEPALADNAPPPPAVGLIVKQDADGRWMDDNRGDWTDLVSGELATASGRRVGWSLPDRDLALIDVDSLEVRYVSGLMNIGMALATHPISGEFTLVGTDAHNQIRFEPNLNGRFLEVLLARVSADGSVLGRADLNPHVDRALVRLPEPERRRSLGDPRGIVWSDDGQRGWVVGMGSNNLLPIHPDGRRAGEPIAVGEGPASAVFDATRQLIYVWNHFEASLSVVDPARGRERQRIAVFNPLPTSIRAGRPLLYATHRTSGQGHLACASCHVDGRIDRLGWDLGDPSQPPQPFEQNCITERGRACEDFHAMKGPMTTQTLQDIIGHEPHHWRGDRDGIEAFNPAFEGLLGAEGPLTAVDMQAFEDFLATLRFPPNPYRGLDNGLPVRLPLPGHYTSGRFATAGQPLPDGNARQGLLLFTLGFLDPPFQCANCHTLPTGMAVNGPMFTALGGVFAGGSNMPLGPMGENHLGIVSSDGSTNVSIKVPQLRNQHEKVGFDSTLTESRAGFGFLHDGSVDSLSRFFSAAVFNVRSDQDIADLVALQLAFSGSDFSLPNPNLGAAPPLSLDSHAAVGQQRHHAGGARSNDLDLLLQLAGQGKIDLVAWQSGHGFAYDVDSQHWLPDGATSPIATDELTARASPQQPQQFMALPPGLADRLGIDRDGDGLSDAAEIAQGSDPADADSVRLRPVSGLWFNPERSGHGIDLQHAGEHMAVTWYTYDQDGQPVWYQGLARWNQPWRAELLRYRRNDGAEPVAEPAGELILQFDSARRLRFEWRLGEQGGSETMQPLLEDTVAAAPNVTGIYYDPADPGWGLSVTTEGDARGALLYYYGDNGAPRWALGVGDNALASEAVTLWTFRGFCPACPAHEPAATEVGLLRWRFSHERSFELDTELGGEHPWTRTRAPMHPLSDPAFDPRWR